jgi:hypothetical protein
VIDYNDGEPLAPTRLHGHDPAALVLKLEDGHLPQGSDRAGRLAGGPGDLTVEPCSLPSLAARRGGSRLDLYGRRVLPCDYERIPDLSNA